MSTTRSVQEMRQNPPIDLEMMGGPFGVMMMAPGEFHLSDGVTFKRDETGKVIIRRWVREPAGWRFYSLTAMPIEASAWASVVAHVSARGETGETHRRALDFYEGRDQ